MRFLVHELPSSDYNCIVYTLQQFLYTAYSNNTNEKKIRTFRI
jgi:hypothetical protein